MANFKVKKKDGKKTATDTGACLAGLRLGGSEVETIP